MGLTFSAGSSEGDPQTSKSSEEELMIPQTSKSSEEEMMIDLLDNVREITGAGHVETRGTIPHPVRVLWDEFRRIRGDYRRGKPTDLGESRRQ